MKLEPGPQPSRYGRRGGWQDWETAAAAAVVPLDARPPPGPGAGSAAPFVHLESREAGGAGWSPGLAALWLGETLSQAEPLVSREMNILLERRPPSQALKEKQGALGLVRGPRGARRQRMWLFCCAWCASLATH